MKKNINFKERVEIAKVNLFKQAPTTLKEKRKQAKWLKNNSNNNNL